MPRRIQIALFAMLLNGCVVVHSQTSTLVPYVDKLPLVDSPGPVFSNDIPGLIRCSELTDHSTQFTFRERSGATVQLRPVKSVPLGSTTLHKLKIRIEDSAPPTPPPHGHSGVRSWAIYMACSDAGFAELDPMHVGAYVHGFAKSYNDKYILRYVSTDPRHIRLRPGLIIPTTLLGRGTYFEMVASGYKVSTADLIAIGPLMLYRSWEHDRRGRLRFGRILTSVRLCPTPNGLRKCRYSWLFRGDSPETPTTQGLRGER